MNHVTQNIVEEQIDEDMELLKQIESSERVSELKSG